MENTDNKTDVKITVKTIEDFIEVFNAINNQDFEERQLTQDNSSIKAYISSIKEESDCIKKKEVN